MTWYEILIIIVAAAFVIAVAVSGIVKHLHGKGGCCSDCSACGGCDKCTDKNKK